MRRAFLGFVYAACMLVAAAASLPAHAAFNSTTPRATFEGKHNYVVIGGSLRTSEESGHRHELTTSSTATLAGIPEGAEILAAYLYWGGSGFAADDQVSFGPQGAQSNITVVDSQAKFATSYSDGLNAFYFFGRFYDVTSIVRDKPLNTTYQFSGLDVVNIQHYASQAATVAGWALVVVYTHEDEPYRDTRIYDGLQSFHNSLVTVSLTGLRVPSGAGSVQGKVTTITWEGDEELSGNEILTFNGSALADNCPSSGGIFNSRWYGPMPGGVWGCITTYGVDIDTFDVSNSLSPGQTGATFVYQAGADMVLLAAQVISTTSTPVANLGIVKTANETEFVAGGTGSYTIKVSNDGPGVVTGTTSVTDVLPDGLSLVSSSGDGWSCTEQGQEVTCTNEMGIPVGGALPDLTLTVAVEKDAPPTLQNTAVVSNPMVFDNVGGNDQSTVTVPVRRSDLHESIKLVEDLNAGVVEPGDRLRYTIVLKETGGEVDASDVSVVDDLPANVGQLQILSLPEGATDSSVSSGGANGTGQVNVSGITVAAGGEEQIVFEVVVSPDAEHGATIANTATASNGNGPGATPSAPVLEVVVVGEEPATGNKILYLHGGDPLTLSRTPPSAADASTIIPPGQSLIWTLIPAIAPGKTLVLEKASTAITVQIWVRCTLENCSQSGAGHMTRMNVHLSTTRDGVSQLFGSGNDQSIDQTWRAETFTIPLPSDTLTLLPGDALSLEIENVNTIASGSLEVAHYLGRPSQISFHTPTVINVDSVTLHSEPYPSDATKTVWAPGDTLYVRAKVSDPFGDYDISSATLRLTDDAGNTVVSNELMTARDEVSDDPAVKIFEYVVSPDDAFVIPGSFTAGTWKATVTAAEGTEGSVSHAKSKTFQVEPPAPVELVVTKQARVISDPVNGTENPKAIPGAIVEYEISVTNPNSISIDENSLVVVDPIPEHVAMCVADIAEDACTSVLFEDASSSGLTYDPESDLKFSSDHGESWNYDPHGESDGTDPAVTDIRINPRGAFNGNNSQFTVKFRVMIK